MTEHKIKDVAETRITDPSTSPWEAPVVLVKKKDGTCCLNEATWKDSNPLPRVDDALNYIAGSSSFSSLDLQSSYWQVELAPEAHPKNCLLYWPGTVAIQGDVLWPLKRPSHL